MEKNQAQPWWKFGHVWLILAGPAVVVVASFITLYLAIKTPDPVVNEELRGPSSQAAKAELAPAMQARNHAATGVPSKP